MTDPAPHRLVVAAVVRDAAGRCLLWKMPPHRGVFPGQWGLPGGGVSPGETLDRALARALREEVGLEIAEARPLFFKERVADNLFPDGTRRRLHMVFLVSECRAREGAISLNEEFEASAGVAADRLGDDDRNSEARDTFERMGLPVARSAAPRS